MTSRARPLSPHVRNYRFPFVAILSISHRITGVALALGSLLLAYWLASAAYGPASFEQASRLLGSPIGRLVLFGFSFALFYHLANGIRHLFWDVGLGFELPTAVRSGHAAVIAAVLLTVATWAVALS
ncbi:succinate dehydrogenase, cytochrome b556 subunit [Telmatospirillum sp.]|uniref:succinate dehydrogenase, cytochrome b556 subunit n=1 Tax=Telmatospirillum sp. TaxID=2079197 RepID=UPI00284349BD|nr:succinate dehydrogenase, cytochrome b556 subunit [Telmatospirillum sp.]MDR3441079.1 succinate dehydrogenase, cytochrome b556 subunit [Telmatospirillum sp.]